jgi:hypothetical protein
MPLRKARIQTEALDCSLMHLDECCKSWQEQEEGQRFLCQGGWHDTPGCAASSWLQGLPLWGETEERTDWGQHKGGEEVMESGKASCFLGERSPEWSAQGRIPVWNERERARPPWMVEVDK